MTSEKTACILCSRNCGLKVDIENGNFVRIRGDEDHPVSKGYICQKAARLQYYQSHGDRLTHPLKRQPDGSFSRVSWDEALSDIAQRLLQIREQHGGDAFAFLGGGGQGNHLGGAYGSGQLRAAMKSRNAYNSLGQEKTGDFWLNGRLFGRQDCHSTEDVEHADFVLFIGCNPFQAHGIPNARDVLRDFRKDPGRTMVVIDPRRTETAKQADIHLQLKPGTDAYLMSAMLAIILRENLHDRDFLARHCSGFDNVEAALRAIPVEDYARHADVPLADVERVARGFATARSACVRVDLGIQHTLHTMAAGCRTSCKSSGWCSGSGPSPRSNISPRHWAFTSWRRTGKAAAPIPRWPTSSAGTAPRKSNTAPSPTTSTVISAAAGRCAPCSWLSCCRHWYCAWAPAPRS